MKFLSDHDSYLMYIDTYLKSFYNLATGGELIENFDVTTERSFKLIIEQLQARKSSVKKRLIEEDSNSTNEKFQLRGELNGIKYAMKTNKLNKS